MLVMPTPPTDPPDARSASPMAVKALSRNANASTSTPCGPVYQGVAARPDPTGLSRVGIHDGLRRRRADVHSEPGHR